MNKTTTLPGEREFSEELQRMIRVNHAGEYGAKRIYQGQLAVLGKTPAGETIRHMAAQEQVHLDAFDALMRERGVRPTVLSPLWHVGGFALGAITALMGKRAAMACTEAVETVIDEHYAQQLEVLNKTGQEPQLAQMIDTFRAEEVEHRDIAIEHGAQQTPLHLLLTGLIKAQTRLAIFLSKSV